MRLPLLVAASLLLSLGLLPSAEAIPPVCIERSAGAPPVGTVEVWVTCYPGVWRCDPGEAMPECDRVVEP